MNRVTIKAGSLPEFFHAARETAREIDQGKKVTRKHRIWVEPEDFVKLLRPAQKSLVRYLRGKNRILFTDLLLELHRTPISIKRDLHLLSKYHLVHIYTEKTPDNRRSEVIEPTFGNDVLEFTAEI